MDRCRGKDGLNRRVKGDESVRVCGRRGRGEGEMVAARQRLHVWVGRVAERSSIEGGIRTSLSPRAARSSTGACIRIFSIIKLGGVIVVAIIRHLIHRPLADWVPEEALFAAADAGALERVLAGRFHAIVVVALGRTPVALVLAALSTIALKERRVARLRVESRL